MFSDVVESQKTNMEFVTAVLLAPQTVDYNRLMCCYLNVGMSGAKFPQHELAKEIDAVGAAQNIQTTFTLLSVVE